MDPHTKSYVCVHVFTGERPVLYVTRADGDWSLLCGDLHPDEPDQYRLVGIGHIIDADPTLAAVLDLVPEEEAEREQVGGDWVRNTP